MEEKSEILDKIGRRDGMTVPEGYFEDFAERMTASLPVREFEQERQPERRNFWQKVRPYVYMAAMFAGIWCMMKMLSMMKAGDNDLSIENYPALVAALNDEDFLKDYVYPDIDQYDLYEDLYDSGISPDEIFFSADDETSDFDMGEPDADF